MKRSDVYTQAEIERLAEDALNVMCAYVREQIGQTDGGVAGMFWDNERMRSIIVDYVATEISNRN